MNPRVVIADADEPLLSAYRAFLMAEGIEVVGVSTGLACLNALRRLSIDALILDPDLRWGSGLDVLAVAREEKLSLPPILFLTAQPAQVTEWTVPTRD